MLYRISLLIVILSATFNAHVPVQASVFGLKTSGASRLERSPWWENDPTIRWQGNFEVSAGKIYGPYLVLVGTFEGEMDLGSVVLATEQNTAAFFAVLDRESHFLLWVGQADGPQPTEGLALVLDELGLNMVGRYGNQMFRTPLTLDSESFLRQISYINLDGYQTEILKIQTFLPPLIGIEMPEGLKGSDRFQTISSNTGSNGNPNGTGGSTGGNGSGGI